jgi:hypothetical protein
MKILSIIRSDYTTTVAFYVILTVVGLITA